ncbi:cell division protein ZapA [Nordella sp. HKS 07]|jgi:cell division protein ZapA|uniref:cell division protein ZapA n=1 Tax=Nordella sp. HKS 07 TaxID=2712222 RepID=UPI0013E19823|nr:cell division protein ZapA [Nordella sp. HKS 07]QIG46882.1 cell division protein ZapA [Nordella sp. HKS 07]
MAQVIVTVNDRPYTMQCPDGEEEQLRELAKLLDTEVSRIKSNVGAVGDIRLLVMAGLMVADRLSESVRRIEELEDQLRSAREARNVTAQQAREMEAKFAERMEIAAQRLQGLAAKIP